MFTYGAVAGARSRRHLAIAATFAVAAAGLIAAMSRTDANAATANDVALHCRDGSPVLENCDFIQKTLTETKGNSFRVSEVQGNCGQTDADPFEFAVTVQSAAEALVETEKFSRIGGTLGFPGVFDLVASAVSEKVKIIGFSEEVTTTTTIKSEVEPGKRAAIYFRPDVMESAGFLEATYKEAEADGTKVFFFPARDASTVLARFPIGNDNGDPKGFYWIRTVDCAGNTSDLGGVSRIQIPNFDTADFGALSGFGVVDTPITVE